MVLSSSFLWMGNVGLGQVFVSVVLAYVFYCLGVALYNITLHPLAKIPGPKLRGAFAFWHYWEIYSGDVMSNTKAFHDYYGDTVRVAPGIVSFNNAQAWQDIYGQRPGKKIIPQDKEVYAGGDEVADILLSNDADHARIRRLLSHAFSESALNEQESLQNVFFDLLFRKLYENVDGPTHGKVELVHWLNFTAFDLIGDLCFGESFGALKSGEYHPWVKNIITGFKFARFFRIMKAYPLIGMPLMAILALNPSLHKGWHEHFKYTTEKAGRRLDIQTDRRDIMSYILRHNDEKGMSRDEIIKTSSTLIIAGSETTATVMCGTVFNLLKNPDTLKKLVTEVRTAFSDSSEITFVKLSGLRYLNACLQETMRIYPPAPMALPRRTEKGGAIINGHFIPENVSVGVHQWSATHSEANFSNPEEYIPERWLNDPLFASDKRAALQPFSIGPRACLGRHLAMAQMKSVLARLVWHFDMSLCEESTNWNHQKFFLLWEKPDLMIKLVPKS